jgi:hypothetical protein
MDSIYRQFPGGSDLIDWFDGEPRFHDAEIVSLNLHRGSTSTLNVHFWTSTGEVDDRGYFLLDKHVVVTFAMKVITDLEIDGFNRRNIIYGLTLHRAQERPERAPYVLGTSPQDYEIALEDCRGISGWIRFQALSISLAPGKPKDSYF